MSNPKLTPLEPDFSWKVPLQQIEIANLRAELDAMRRRAEAAEAALAADVAFERVQARLASAYQENDALVEQHNEMDTQLADATARAEALALELNHLRPEWRAMRAERDEWQRRAEAAEAKLAAVPVEELRHIFYAGRWKDEWEAFDKNYDVVDEWLAQQSEGQP